jgi:dynein heavy chain
MVYVDPKNLNYEPFIWKWCNARTNTEEGEILRSLFTKYMSKCIDFCLEAGAYTSSLLSST